jgi:hypothetical protein
LEKTPNEIRQANALVSLTCLILLILWSHTLEQI